MTHRIVDTLGRSLKSRRRRLSHRSEWGLLRCRGRGDHRSLLNLRLLDLDVIRNRGSGTGLAFRVVRSHNSNADAEDSLSQKHGTDRLLHIEGRGVTGREKEPITELHGLSALSPQLTADGDNATDGAGVHDVPDHSVAGTTNGHTLEQLEPKRLGLGHGAETARLHTLHKKLHRQLLNVESFLDQRSQLSNSDATLTKNLSSSSGTNDDLHLEVSLSNLNTGVAILSENFAQELIELGLENALLDELRLLVEVVLRKYERPVSNTSLTKSILASEGEGKKSMVLETERPKS